MTRASRLFQVFAKPIGSVCNLGCNYCYYLKKQGLYPEEETFRMSDDILEDYILQHISASIDSVIRFSWHGGEPTMLGLDYFEKIVAIQKKHQPSGQLIANGIQTNGTLLNNEWCKFLAKERFSIGLSMDGPQEMHDRYRVTKDGRSTHVKAMQGYNLLRQHKVIPDILCVVNSYNVQYPLQVYRFFKEINAQYIGFLPLVEKQADTENGVSELTVPAESFGNFLCTIFDEWHEKDIGKVKIQTIDEAAKTAFDQEHELCIFRKTCGDVPVVEYNGDFYSCDHFVDGEHHLGNIQKTPFVELLESQKQIEFGMSKENSLPRYCKKCEVLDMCSGECPKNRFIQTPDGEDGLNYLCSGYRRFFNHCKPFVKTLRNVWNEEIAKQQIPQASTRSSRDHTRIGRNDPCPCGSGKKYKKCCLP